MHPEGWNGISEHYHGVNCVLESMATIMASSKNRSKLYTFLAEKFFVESGVFFALIDYIEGT